MESLQDSNLSDENVHTVCYNMNAAYFKIGDFLNWYIANCIVGSLLAIASTLENLCVLLTIWKTSILHIPSNMILFCLALSDLGVGLLSQPLAVINTVAKIQGSIGMACVTGAAVAALSTYLCGVSLICVTAVSVDRYLALYLHLRYKQLVTNIRVIVLLVLTWLLVALVLLTRLWFPSLIDRMATAVGSICILVTSGCFFRIYLVLRYHHRKIRIQTRPTTTAPNSEERHYRVLQEISSGNVHGLYRPSRVLSPIPLHNLCDCGSGKKHN